MTFKDEVGETTGTTKLRLTPNEEEFIRKVEQWATDNKRLTAGTINQDDEDSETDKERYDKTATERQLTEYKHTGLATYDNRLAIVRNIPKLTAMEVLTGVDNYDKWCAKMTRFFAAYDVMEYIEKQLHDIIDTDKTKQQLDAAVLLTIHGNISEGLQQMVNNEMHAYDAWEALRKLFTGNTVQEILNIGGKMLELPFNLTTPVTTFFAEAEAGFRKFHRIGFTVPERLKCAFLLHKIYPRLPATAASITALPDDQITVKYLQEKVIKAVELLSRSNYEQGELGDPRPSGTIGLPRQLTTYPKRLAITDGSGIDKKQTTGTGRGMTIGDSSGRYGNVGYRKCLRCFASDHLVDDCPKPDTRRCYTCNLTGHISKNCPQNGEQASGSKLATSRN